MGAGNKTLSSDPEILLHCVLTMTKMYEIETPVGSVLLCGKYHQMKGKQNLRSVVRGVQALGQRLQSTTQVGLCGPFGGQGCN